MCMILPPASQILQSTVFLSYTSGCDVFGVRISWKKIPDDLKPMVPDFGFLDVPRKVFELGAVLFPTLPPGGLGGLGGLFFFMSCIMAARLLFLAEQHLQRQY